jgi:hypothetical protein
MRKSGAGLLIRQVRAQSDAAEAILSGIETSLD